MKSWTIMGNNHPDHMTGIVVVCNEPWWLALIGWFESRVLSWLCCGGCNPIARIPLPNWRKLPRCAPEDETPYGWRDWYGDLGGVLHQALWEPLFYWYWARHVQHEVHVEIGFEKMKALFEATRPDYFASDFFQRKDPNAD